MRSHAPLVGRQLWLALLYDRAVTTHHGICVGTVNYLQGNRLGKVPLRWVVMHDDNVDVHVQAVEKFVAITQTTPSFARVFLEDDGWDVAASVQRFNIWSKKDEEPQSISPSTSDGTISKLFLRNLRVHVDVSVVVCCIVVYAVAKRHLNWWCCNGGGQRLWPLSTTGDGNCLLHAASLGLWGVHDRHLMLRKTLHEMITQGSRRHTLYRRWRFAESKANQESGLTLSDDEWQKEWQILLDSAAATPRKNTQRRREDIAVIKVRVTRNH
uniref:ubiquitinyl hydrolase 1 n=1 Tax=Parascaris equorum TaxID=6256 RepID=A0A914RL71_PAREQ